MSTSKPWEQKQSPSTGPALYPRHVGARVVSHKVYDMTTGLTLAKVVPQHKPYEVVNTIGNDEHLGTFSQDFVPKKRNSLPHKKGSDTDSFTFTKSPRVGPILSLTKENGSRTSEDSKCSEDGGVRNGYGLTFVGAQHSLWMGAALDSVVVNDFGSLLTSSSGHIESFENLKASRKLFLNDNATSNQKFHDRRHGLESFESEDDNLFFLRKAKHRSNSEEIISPRNCYFKPSIVSTTTTTADSKKPEWVQRCVTGPQYRDVHRAAYVVQ